MAADTLQRLLDLDDIRQLKARYFRLLDEHRWTEWREIFTPDVWVRVQNDPSDRETPLDFDGVEDFVSRVSAMLEGVVHAHHGHTAEIEFEGEDRARGIWAMQDHLVHPDKVIDGFGHYREEYRRGTDGKWRIARLHLTRLLMEQRPR